MCKKCQNYPYRCNFCVVITRFSMVITKYVNFCIVGRAFTLWVIYRQKDYQIWNWVIGSPCQWVIWVIFHVRVTGAAF